MTWSGSWFAGWFGGWFGPLVRAPVVDAFPKLVVSVEQSMIVAIDDAPVVLALGDTVAMMILEVR